MCTACDPRNRPDHPPTQPRLGPIGEPADEADPAGLALVMWSWFLTAMLVGITAAVVLVTG